MTNGNIIERYERIWRSVQKEYCRGFCWSERGLQALLHEELRRFDEFNVVAEPTWRSARPDLVIVSSGRITDIFEIKFLPHTSYPGDSDVKKLLSYVGTDKNPVSLNPETGQWDYSHCLPVQDDCRLHFVVVAQRGREEQWRQCDERVTRWCGGTGDRYADPWYIDRA